jgi:hypothetical protein
MIDRAEAGTFSTIDKLCASNVSGSLRSRVGEFGKRISWRKGKSRQIWSRPSLLVAFASLVLHVLATCRARRVNFKCHIPAIEKYLSRTGWNGSFVRSSEDVCLEVGPCAHVSDDWLCPRRSPSKVLTLSFQYEGQKPSDIELEDPVWVHLISRVYGTRLKSLVQSQSGRQRTALQLRHDYHRLQLIS